MTRPISPSSQNYTAYDPSLEISRADGGAGGAGGARAVGGGGAEGATSAPPLTPPAPEEIQPHPDCVSELLKTISACGTAYIASRFPSPATPFALINCGGNLLDLIECAQTDATLTKEP